MSQNKPKIKVALKYCGSCNPHFDLAKTGRSLVETIERLPRFTLVPISAHGIDIVVILCGCPRACVNREEVRARGKHYMLINDESLSDTDILETRLLACVQS